MMSLARPDPRRLPSRLRFQRPPLHALRAPPTLRPRLHRPVALCVHTPNSSINVYMHPLCRIVFLLDSRSIRSFNDAHPCIVQ